MCIYTCTCVRIKLFRSIQSCDYVIISLWNACGQLEAGTLKEFSFF